MSMQPPSTLDGLIDTLALDYEDRPAVIGEHGSLSFRALAGAAESWGRALRSWAGDQPARIGLLGGNGPQWLAVATGVWRAGLTLVPLSTFATPHELSDVLADADVDLLLVEPRVRTHDYAELVRRTVLPACLREVVTLDAAADAFLARGSARAAMHGDPESIACVLYTSGTTGKPKGVMLSHRAILATVWPTAERCGLTPDDRLLSSLPLFWVAGLVIRALPTLASGCTLILPQTFDSGVVVDLLRQHHPTALHLRPPQVGLVTTHPRFEPSLFAGLRRGGGRVEWYAPHVDASRTHLITGYGMTEMAGYVTALRWDDAPEDRDFGLGTPLPGVELRIVDESGRPCEPGTTGEIRVRGPGLFSGYHKHPARTGLDADGFLCTGDLGHIDARGAFAFTGRSKDLLRVKGINVSPVEVENVLASHPAVEAAYVVGLPAEALDQQLVALIVARPSAAAVEKPLRALADGALSHYKRPQHYLFIERGDVALSGTSKPLRSALAALAAARL
jgi:fatty-acyl-CoA synthase